MTRTQSAWRVEVRKQLRLAVPVTCIQLGLALMGAVDGAFLGRVDTVQFAATAIGNAYVFLFLSFGMGFLTVLDPIVSQAFGAEDHGAIARALKRGLFLAVILSIATGLALLPVARVLSGFGIEADVVEVAGRYTHISILSVPAFLFFIALRHTLQAMHCLRPLFAAVLLTNILNVFLDWLWIEGHLGFEARGAAGAAWATVVARWAMVFGVMWLARRKLSSYLSLETTGVLRREPLLRMVRVGLPPALQWFLEIAAFASITAMVGLLGAENMAGHQVAMHLATTSFMVPLGISMAASVRVGNEIGRGNVEGMRLAARVAIVSGVVTMACFGILFLTLPWPLARILTNIEGVLKVAVVLIPLAGLFQVFDGTQVVAIGVMRGMGDMRIPMLLHALGFWACAIPLAYILAFPLKFGAVGLWYGLVIGLGAVALAQFLRLRVMLRRDVGRLEIDH